jgi:hypothetical protein
MFKMGSCDPFGHLKAKLWPKERPGVKLAVWLSTIKIQESPRFPCVQVVCDIPLKNFRQGLQLGGLHLHFGRKSSPSFQSEVCNLILVGGLHPHLSHRFAHKVMGPPQFLDSQVWEFRDSHFRVLRKMPLGCWSHGQALNILQGGRWWLPPSPSHGLSCESEFARGSS